MILNSDSDNEFYNFSRKYGGLDFPNVKFRPGSSFTTAFGMDNTFNELRFHPAIDRGSSTKEIYAPFDLTHIELNTAGLSVWGIQLKLHTDYGFEVRVAHIDDLPDDLMYIVKKKLPVKSGTYLCEAGNAGKSTGIHTHTEVVSYLETAPILDKVLFLKFGGLEKIGYTLNDIVKYLDKEDLNENPSGSFSREMDKKRISFINEYVCRRIDYYNNSRSTFYSSQALFNM